MKLRWLGLLALMTVSVQGQTLASYTGNATQPANNVPAGAAASIMTVPFAIVTVCAYPAVNSPCTNAVPIFQDQAGAQPITQPMTTDATGRFAFWIAAGTYTYSVQNQAGAVVGIFPFTVGGGGGGGCTMGAVPNTSVLYNNSGNCAGSPNFITNSAGAVQILNGGTQASFNVQSANSSGFNYFRTDGNSVTYRGTGASSGGQYAPGFNIVIDDGDMISGGSAPNGIIGLFDTTGVYRAGKNAIGMESLPAVGIGVAAGGITNFEADEPTMNSGATLAKHWGFYSGMQPRPTSYITGENYAFLSETASGLPPSANFCDFVGRDNSSSAIRVKLGCGANNVSTFSGPIATGVTGNTDIAGFITLSGGTGTYTFTSTNATAPVCTATDTTAVNAVKASASTTVLTVTGTGTDVIAYICIKRT